MDLSAAGVVCPTCGSVTKTNTVWSLPDNPYVMIPTQSDAALTSQSPQVGVGGQQVYQLLESSLGKIQDFKLIRSRKFQETTQLRETLQRLVVWSEEMIISNQKQQTITAEVEAQLEDLKRKLEENIHPRDHRRMSFVYQQTLELNKYLNTELEFSHQEQLKDSIHASRVKVEFDRPAQFLSFLGASNDKLFIDLSIGPEDDPKVVVIKTFLVDILASKIAAENPFLREMSGRLEARPVSLSAEAEGNPGHVKPFASVKVPKTDAAGSDSVFSCDEMLVISPRATSNVLSAGASSKPSFSDVAKKPAVSPSLRLVKAPKRLIKPNSRPHCFFQLQVDDEAPFRVVFELRPDMAPRMVENFQRLCDGLPDGRGYRGSKIFRAKTDDYVAGGDFENNDGTGGRSSFSERHFQADQCTLRNHKGALRMKGGQRTSDGRCKVGSQFMIWVEDLEDKDFKFSLVFGAVVDGLEELQKVSRIKARQRNATSWLMEKSVTVIDCGTL